MRNSTDKVVLTEGMIRKIRFDNAKERAFISLSGGEEVEFRNTKTARATDVLKKRLNVGEHVIVSGQKMKGASQYIFGYKVERSGKIGDGSISFIKGTIKDITKTPTGVILSLECAGKHEKVRISKGICPNKLKTGSSIVLSCEKYVKQECIEPCGEIGISKCGKCPKKSKNYGLYVIEAKEC